MDEPTGNLDPKTAESVLELLMALNEELKISFVVVTHDPQIASQLDRTTVDGVLGPSLGLGNLPLFIGLRYFSSGARRSRLVSFISLLALFGLSLGVGLLILVLSVMNGFDREMREHILSIVPHVQITNSTAISNWQSQRELIATVPNVKEVTPFNELEGIIFSKNNTRPIQIMGLDHAILPKGLEAVLKSANLTIPADGELLLTQPIVDSLDLSLGQTINLILPLTQIGGLEFLLLRLTGIFATRTEIDQIFRHYFLKSSKSYDRKQGDVFGLRIQVEDLFQSRNSANLILSQLPFGFKALDWTQTHGNLYQAIQLSQKHGQFVSVPCDWHCSI